MKRLLSAALLVVACQGGTPALTADEAAWCGQLENSGAVLAEAKALGVDPARNIFVSDYANRDGYRRACHAAYGKAH